MPLRRAPVFVALTLMAVLVAGACNRDSDDDGGSPDRTTTTEQAGATTTTPDRGDPGSADQAFAAAADDACRAALDELDEVAAPSDERSIAEYLDRAYDILDDLGQVLGALEPPAGGEESFEELIGTLADEVLALRHARTAHEAGDTAERDRRFEEVAGLERRFGLQAKAMALTGCGRFADAR